MEVIDRLFYGFMMTIYMFPFVMACYLIGALIHLFVKIFKIGCLPRWKNLNFSAFVIIFSTIVPLTGLILHYYFKQSVSDYYSLLFNFAQICWLALPFQLIAVIRKKNGEKFLTVARWIIIVGIIGAFFYLPIDAVFSKFS